MSDRRHATRPIRIDRHRRAQRSGLTLVEMLLAGTIVTMSIGALGVMARAVQISSEYNEGYGTAIQHARVALERIARAVNNAYCTGISPGAWVTEDADGGGSYPDTLVVWRPVGSPANPAGPPLARELVVFCPDPTMPNRLIEVTAPTDATVAPTPGSPAFKTFVDGLKSSPSSRKTPLTHLMRTASGGGPSRGAVRFAVTLNPTAAQWSSYTAGTTTWANLPWPQGIVGPNVGLRQVGVRTELQLLPEGEWVATDDAAKQPIPYFGSATKCYTMTP